jgi:hypothetical protein
VSRLFILCWLAPLLASGARLSERTSREFDRYVADADARMLAAGPLRWLDAAQLDRLRSGQVEIKPWNSAPTVPVHDGLIHDWAGAAFVPGVKLEQVETFLRDYGRHAAFYKPEVLLSKVLEHDGDHYKTRLRLLKHKVITVVLEADYDVVWLAENPGWRRARIQSARIAEVEEYGKPGEKMKPDGEGWGFLWRMNSYWNLAERDGGVYVELRSISLTRNIPAGLGWIIGPMVTQLPRESLEKTLTATRAGVLQR